MIKDIIISLLGAAVLQPYWTNIHSVWDLLFTYGLAAVVILYAVLSVEDIIKDPGDTTHRGQKDK